VVCACAAVAGVRPGPRWPEWPNGNQRSESTHLSAPREAAANRYNVWKLVYYETGYAAAGAIAREKQIKAGSRQKKIELINSTNPEWRDLYEDL
jgi:putative endonuclease